MKYIIGNWKMNPASTEEAINLAKEIVMENVSKEVEVGIAPPFAFLGDVKKNVNPQIGLWGQDAFYEEKGAYTGEISFSMLENFDSQGSILGHSERRKYFCETNEMVNRKVHAALLNNQRIILCVGEWQRKFSGKIGEMLAKKFVLNQLRRCLFRVSEKDLKPGSIIIAYEPVWAIGTGKSATQEDAKIMSEFIKKEVEKIIKIENIPVLYGGSVNAGNAENFLKEKIINGLLIGGASLNSKEFNYIIKVSNNYD